jgi:hypothetical protein
MDGHRERPDELPTEPIARAVRPPLGLETRPGARRLRGADLDGGGAAAVGCRDGAKLRPPLVFHSAHWVRGTDRLSGHDGVRAADKPARRRPAQSAHVCAVSIQSGVLSTLLWTLLRVPRTPSFAVPPRSGPSFGRPGLGLPILGLGVWVGPTRSDFVPWGRVAAAPRCGRRLGRVRRGGSSATEPTDSANWTVTPPKMRSSFLHTRRLVPELPELGARLPMVHGSVALGESAVDALEKPPSGVMLAPISP